MFACSCNALTCAMQFVSSFGKFIPLAVARGALSVTVRNEAKAKNTLLDLFKKVDPQSIGAVSVDELKKVFGDHVSDRFPADQTQVTQDEWLAGIIGDTADLSEDEFQSVWVQRMNAAIKDAAQRESIAAAEEADDEYDNEEYEEDFE